ncbi:hypothetical protein bsdE14_33310 [Clostridium omnivorum]|uniref:Uncharacterized protein n=1 Tax=Clostridium omnivorum TaxID=1604902 RepID=A0ABQ5N9S9_9CLOT|nr:hypothetical protein bsdE14_33310 [Clostridium sp. E14]
MKGLFQQKGLSGNGHKQKNKENYAGKQVSISRFFNTNNYKLLNLYNVQPVSKQHG